MTKTKTSTSVAWVWRWASSKDWQLLCMGASKDERAAFIQKMRKTGPIVVAPLRLAGGGSLG